MKFDITNRFTGSVLFTAEIDRLFTELPERERQARRERLDRQSRILSRFASPAPLPVIDSPSAMFVIAMIFALAGLLALWVAS